MNAPFQSDQVFMPQCVTSAERCAAIWASLFDWAVVMFWNIIVVFCFSHGAVLNRELLHFTRSDSIEFIVCVCMRILHLLIITRKAHRWALRYGLPRFPFAAVRRLSPLNRNILRRTVHDAGYRPSRRRSITRS